MPLTVIQIRNAKPGLRPVKPSSKVNESNLAKQKETKGKAAGEEAKSAGTGDAPRFIVTKKPYKSRRDAVRRTPVLIAILL